MLNRLNVLLYFCLLPFTAYACPPQGDATNARAIQQNRLKNRTTLVAGHQLALTVSDFAKPGDDTKRFNYNQSATLTGYVVLVKNGGIESCNCHAKDAPHRDRHIYVGQTPTAKIRGCVVVEVTPNFYASHPNWQTLGGLVGHKVRFTGDLFCDEEHKQNAVNTAPHNPRPWRVTFWEIHPVTKIEVLNG